jgi:hypothetical protein
VSKIRIVVPVLCALAGWLAAPALASTDHPVDGSGTGTTFRTVLDPSFSCNPTDPQTASDYICRERITGQFTETSGYIGSGHMGGRLILDYTTLDANGCIPTKGVLKFITANGFVRAKLPKGAVTCPDPNPDNPGGLIQDYQAIVTTGSNSYLDVSGGSIHWQDTVSPTSPGVYVGDSLWSGIVTTEP